MLVRQGVLPVRVGRPRAVDGAGLRLPLVRLDAEEEEDVIIEPSSDGKHVDLVFHAEKCEDYNHGRVATDQEYIRFDGWGRIRFSEDAWNALFREVAKQIKAQQAVAVVGVVEDSDRVRVTFGDEKTGTTVLMTTGHYEALRRKMLITVQESKLADVSPRGRVALIDLVRQVRATADLSPPVRQRLLYLANDVCRVFGLKDA